MRIFGFCAALLSSLLLGSPAATATVSDPASWSNRELVAQTIFMCSSGGGLNGFKDQIKAGLGGIALVGAATTSSIKESISSLKQLSPNGVEFVVASDEEGGAVQRLKKAIYPLPSALEMGKWSDAKLEDTAFEYGKRMKSLGVDFAFSPVADLSVPGFFIANNGRSFSSNPDVVAKKAIAWAKGLLMAGVIPTVKHWPGHGAVGDTHSFARKTAKLQTLEAKDLIPFNRVIDSGVKLVMVGHLMTEGLTEPHTPASRSPQALAYLRAQIGDTGVIITDSLSMGGATAGLKGKTVEATIRSLRAGADIALVCSGPKDLISQVTKAMSQRRLSRAEMLAKARRILLLKSTLTSN